MRIRIDEGVYIDFYNLHADAGVEDEDNVARTANIQQVADTIRTNSVGNAVIVFGDTNSRVRGFYFFVNLFYCVVLYEVVRKTSNLMPSANCSTHNSIPERRTSGSVILQIQVMASPMRGLTWLGMVYHRQPEAMLCFASRNLLPIFPAKQSTKSCIAPQRL